LEDNSGAKMYPILEKHSLSKNVKMVVVEAPLIAGKAQPGQFVIVRTDERSERIPLTIADFNARAGVITLIIQEVGKSTKQMGRLKVGEGFQNLAGPLGYPTEIENYGTVALVGGGIGVAPLFPITRALKQAGNRVISIIGARNKSLLFWEKRMWRNSDELIVCTDDGSAGRHSNVVQPLQEILSSGEKIDHVWAIGPAIMMMKASEATRPFGVPTVVSLNTVMIDGTGMCGGCRVMLSRGPQFVCIDGPEFDGHQVNWDNMLERLSFYRQEEKEALERWSDHICKLDGVTEEKAGVRENIYALEKTADPVVINA
jgi:ferredoxin/flavodoxin---NADP+ reductase